jgi:hypothetical protein
MGRGTYRTATLAVAVLATLAGGVDAQMRGPDLPVGYVGFELAGANPVGELGSYIDAGFGGQIFGAIPVEPSRHVRMRADFGFLIYGQEHQQVCFSQTVGCRISLDLTTTNAILYGGVGPEVVLADGPVEPYVNVSVGFSYFTTTSSVSGLNEWSDFASTTNYDDAMFAWRAGGGLRLRVRDGRKPVFIDLAAERHQNGVAQFLTEGGIEDHPDGSITLHPYRSEANLWTFRIGVSLGIPERWNGDGR